MPRSAFALVCALALAACDFEQIIELDLPPYESRLVVGGFPAPDSVFAVRIGRSTSALEPVSFDGTGLLLTNARLAVFGSDGAFLDSLLYVGSFGEGASGYYRSQRDLRPEAGQAYTLRAEAAGLPSVEATTQLPEPVSFTARFEGLGNATPYSDRTARLVVVLPDPPEAQTYSLTIEREVEDFDGITRRTLVSFQSDDPVLRDSFDGIDVAVDFDVEIDTNEERLFGRALFRDVLFDGETREIVLNALIYDFEGSTPDAMTIKLASLDDDYVRYQQTLALQDINEGNPFSEPVRLHSNVEGGLGVFAGYTASSVTVPLD